MSEGFFIHISPQPVLDISGPDRNPFLQGLLTQDVAALAPGHPASALLLTAQGKILHELILWPNSETMRIECADAAARQDLADRLARYRLRAAVTLTMEDNDTVRPWGCAPPPGLPLYADPRNPALGWRSPPLPQAEARALIDALTDHGIAAATAEDWTRHRIAHAIPESQDIRPGDYPLDLGFDARGAISWTKGCYVGQELTARMRYRALTKKSCVCLESTNGDPLPENADVFDGEGHPIGDTRSAIGPLALAVLRLPDPPDQTLSCGNGIPVRVRLPD